ncbi:MAG: ribose 5-phosphate isomerase [Peptococcaceae bacterium BRH_c4a]|nr:MAG: ribose 5-phosphate isomerase [Peptococcaceae bacterium BRH_c4a]
MRVAVASDHGGFGLKAEIINFLRARDIEYKDFGTHSEESVDYPDYALAVAESVAAGQFDLGIVCCGTGIGVSMSANKVPGVRAALCHDTFSARMARKHNNANVLTLGQRVVGAGLALDIVNAFLEAGFDDGGRHSRRVAKMCGIEEKYCSK